MEREGGRRKRLPSFFFRSMYSWAMHNHVKQIRVLHLAGATLYLIFGFLLSLKVSASSLSDWLGFGFVAILSYGFAAWEFTRPMGKYSPSVLLFCSNQLAMINMLFFTPKFDNPEVYVFCSALLMVGVVDAAIVLKRRIMVLSHWAMALIVLAALVLRQEFQKDYIVGTVLILLAWKFMINTRMKRSFDEKVKTRQLEAFRATVVTLNHEFNNLAAICQSVMYKLRADAGSGKAVAESDLAMLERNLNRLVSLIKKLRELESYEEVTYVGSVKMLELPKEQSSGRVQKGC